MVAGGLLVVGYRHINSPSMPDAEFAEALDQAIKQGVKWIANNEDKLLNQHTNIAMLYMLREMDQLAPTPCFSELIKEFVGMRCSPRFWKKLVDPDFLVSKHEMNATMKRETLDNRWIIYAINPAEVIIDPADLESLFDTERWEKRKLTHQLWALRHMRLTTDDPRVTDELLGRLCRRIADENTFDLRSLDMNYQRTAFLLGVDCPEMVQRRWIERIIEHQQDDGGWNDWWFWLTSMYHPGDPRESNDHATVQAVWALYQVKYAYPEHFGLPTK